MSTGWKIPVTSRGDCLGLPLPAAVRTALAARHNVYVYLVDNLNGTYTLQTTAPTTATTVSHSGS